MIDTVKIEGTTLAEAFRPTVPQAQHPTLEDADRVRAEHDRAQEDRKMIELEETAISALLHECWMRQMRLRRGLEFQVTEADIMVLEQLKKILDLTPKAKA